MPDPMEDHPGDNGDQYAEATDEPFEEEELDPEEAERRITHFVTAADELPGPPVEELAEQVAELMREAWSDLERIMDGKPHNKVLATQLFATDRPWPPKRRGQPLPLSACSAYPAPPVSRRRRATYERRLPAGMRIVPGLPLLLERPPHRRPGPGGRAEIQ